MKARDTAVESARSPAPFDPVTHFAPWAGPTESGLRRRILNAQLLASARATRAINSRTYSVYSVASELASDWVWRRATCDDLERVLRGLTQLFVAGDNIAHLEGRDA